MKQVSAAENVWTFNATTNWTIPYTGTYKVELWGGEGGEGYNMTSRPIGDFGNYNFGTLSLTSGQLITVYVGEDGEPGENSFKGSRLFIAK